MRSAIATGTLALVAMGLTQACSSEDDGATEAGQNYSNTGGFHPGTGGVVGNGGQAPPGYGGVVHGTGGIVQGTGGAPHNTGGIDGAGGGPSSGGGFNTGGVTSGGTPGSGGVSSGGSVGTGGSSTGGSKGTGTCCSDGNCICRGPAPTALTDRAGEYRTANYRGSTGTIYYPTDADPPFAAVAICGGLTNTGPEMNPWATFYASHGIVTLVTTTGGADLPDLRGQKLNASIAELKAENTKSGSPLNGKLAGRYGTSGYSMGGGGTTYASTTDKTLLTSVGIAPWGPVGPGITTPTLHLCGTADTIAACNLASGSYGQIPGTTQKMLITIDGVSHLQWFNPTVGNGTAGKYALAFQKVYLERDERWKSLLLSKPSNGTVQTNIQ